MSEMVRCADCAHAEKQLNGNLVRCLCPRRDASWHPLMLRRSLRSCTGFRPRREEEAIKRIFEGKSLPGDQSRVVVHEESEAERLHQEAVERMMKGER